MKLLVYTVYRVEQNYYTKSDLRYEYYYGVVVGGSLLNFTRYLQDCPFMDKHAFPSSLIMVFIVTNICILVFVRYLCACMDKHSLIMVFSH